MTDKVNISNLAVDTRSIRQIIFEKANFGAAPVEFQIRGNEDWHPVQWTRHPELLAVRFTDGSVHHVDAAAQPVFNPVAVSDPYRGALTPNQVADPSDINKNGGPMFGKQSVFADKPEYDKGVDFANMGLARTTIMPEGLNSAEIDDMVEDLAEGAIAGVIDDGLATAYPTPEDLEADAEARLTADVDDGMAIDYGDEKPSK